MLIVAGGGFADFSGADQGRIAGILIAFDGQRSLRGEDHPEAPIKSALAHAWQVHLCAVFCVILFARKAETGTGKIGGCVEMAVHHQKIFVQGAGFADRLSGDIGDRFQRVLCGGTNWLIRAERAAGGKHQRRRRAKTGRLDGRIFCAPPRLV